MTTTHTTPSARNNATSKSRSSGKSTRGSTARAPDAIKLLKTDHAKVKALFKEFESSSPAKQQQLAQTICTELTIHTSIEEEIFYPAAREALEDEDMLDEAKVEHESAKQLITQISSGSPGEQEWEARVKVLSEYINHHVKEEEQEMFPALKKTELDLKALGEQMQMRKQQLQSAQDA